MEVKAHVQPPQIPDNLAEIARELAEHELRRGVLRPASAVSYSVFYIIIYLVALAMIAMPLWAFQSAMQTKQPLDPKDAATALFMVVMGVVLGFSLLPTIVRVPRWVTDSRKYTQRALFGGLPTIMYLGCAYHAITLSTRAHDAPGLINAWRRRWVADYLICPAVVHVIGRDPPRIESEETSPKKDNPIDRAFLYGTGITLNKEVCINRLADAWRCVEVVGRYYLRNPKSFEAVLPVLQQWLQVVFMFRKLELSSGTTNLESLPGRLDFIITRTPEIVALAGPSVASPKQVRPVELGIAASITALLALVLGALTIRYGAEKLGGAYVTAIVGMFTVWWTLVQAYRKRKKDAEAQEAIPSHGKENAPPEAIQTKPTKEAGGTDVT